MQLAIYHDFLREYVYYLLQSSLQYEPHVAVRTHFVAISTVAQIKLNTLAILVPIIIASGVWLAMYPILSAPSAAIKIMLFESSWLHIYLSCEQLLLPRSAATASKAKTCQQST